MTRPRHPFRFGEPVYNENGVICFVVTTNPRAKLITVRHEDLSTSQWPWRRLKRAPDTMPDVR
jgi:hypothetical protein